VDTVGKAGQPGEKIQKVISVGMLSEGWDAKTVTHITLRAHKEIAHQRLRLRQRLGGVGRLRPR